MPDITVSFTDAQWTRVIAASSRIKAVGETGDVDAPYLSEMLKKRVQKFVELYEQEKAHRNADGGLDSF